MSEKPKSVEGATDFSILDLAYGRQVQAKIHHHTLAYHIFSWSSTILLAMLGFAVSQGQHFCTQDRWFLTCAVLVLALVVVIWQRRNHIEAQEHADNVTRIETLLRLNIGVGTNPSYKSRLQNTPS